MQQKHRERRHRERPTDEAPGRSSGEGSASALARLRQLERSKAKALPTEEKPS